MKYYRNRSMFSLEIPEDVSGIEFVTFRFSYCVRNDAFPSKTDYLAKISFIAKKRHIFGSAGGHKIELYGSCSIMLIISSLSCPLSIGRCKSSVYLANVLATVVNYSLDETLDNDAICFCLERK